MSTIAHWAHAEIMKETGQYTNAETEAEARRLIERNKLLNEQQRIWEDPVYRGKGQ